MLPSDSVKEVISKSSNKHEVVQNVTKPKSRTWNSVTYDTSNRHYTFITLNFPYCTPRNQITHLPPSHTPCQRHCSNKIRIRNKCKYYLALVIRVSTNKWINKSSILFQIWKKIKRLSPCSISYKLSAPIFPLFKNLQYDLKSFSSIKYSQQCNIRLVLFDHSLFILLLRPLSK